MRLTKEVKAVRLAIANAAVSRLKSVEGSEAENLRYRFALVEESCVKRGGSASLNELRWLGMQAVLAERKDPVAE